jgi:hypothetical protein
VQRKKKLLDDKKKLLHIIESEKNDPNINNEPKSENENNLLTELKLSQ